MVKTVKPIFDFFVNLIFVDFVSTSISKVATTISTYQHIFYQLQCSLNDPALLCGIRAYTLLEILLPYNSTHPLTDDTDSVRKGRRDWVFIPIMSDLGQWGRRSPTAVTHGRCLYMDMHMQHVRARLTSLTSRLCARALASLHLSRSLCSPLLITSSRVHCSITCMCVFYCVLISVRAWADV